MSHVTGSSVGLFLLAAYTEYGSRKTPSGVIINIMCIVSNLFYFILPALLEYNVTDTIYSANIKFLCPVSLKLVVSFSSAPRRLSCPSL